MINYKKAYTELIDEWFEEVTEAMRNASSHNRGDVEVSGKCGCFLCGEVFDPSQANVDDSERDVVRCPSCGGKSLLPDFLGGYVISNDFLRAYMEYRKSLPSWQVDAVEKRIREGKTPPIAFYIARHWKCDGFDQKPGKPDYEIFDILHYGKHEIVHANSEAEAPALHIALLGNKAKDCELAYGVGGLNYFMDCPCGDAEKALHISQKGQDSYWELTVSACGSGEDNLD